MQETKNKVEAILFTTGRFMSIEEISRLVGIASQGIIKQAIEEIGKDYDTHNSSLTISEEENKFKLGIRKQFNYLTTNLLSDSELDNSTTKTLALIAYKRPALQSDIIKMRGNKAYDHITLLREQGFIVSEPKGRSRLLDLTPKFFDYFDIVENQLKEKLLVESPVESSEELKKLSEQNEV